MTVAREAAKAGLVAEPVMGIGPAEQTRQADLARFVSLAASYDGSENTVDGFLADLERRFGADASRDAVQLLTYHSAKGLEWEAVFLPRLEDNELPHWRATRQGMDSEERRLLYVGITRAKRHLWLSRTREGHDSPFLAELGVPILQTTTRASATRRQTRTRVPDPARAATKLKDGWLPTWMRDRRDKN